MPNTKTLKDRGYERIYETERFEIWHNPDKDRVYIPIVDPPSRDEVDKAFVAAAGASERPIDLITDHQSMSSIETAQPHELSACFDRFFDLLEIRNVVRVCSSDEGCRICIPLDARLSTEEKGRLLGRTATFEDADRLLDQQHGLT
ncbi:MAG: hypothetical protein K9M82_04115 [Deltaproteobacteria bacterium]|nr:hypothetical protein [Deltaproteobacteria bacterium]